MLPERSASPDLMTADKPSRSLGGPRTSSPSFPADETEGELAMIRPETQRSRLLRKTANLLNSVAEAAWTSDIPSPVKWDLHRIGTDDYLAQRDILDRLGQDADPCETRPCIEIAAALEEAAHTLAAIPQVFRDLDTGLLKERLSSLAQRALALTPGPRNPRPNSYPRLVPAALPQCSNHVLIHALIWRRQREALEGRCFDTRGARNCIQSTRSSEHLTPSRRLRRFASFTRHHMLKGTLSCGAEGQSPPPAASTARRVAPGGRLSRADWAR